MFGVISSNKKETLGKNFFSLEGNIYNKSARETARVIKVKGAKGALREFEGQFALAGVRKNQLELARDPLGIQPLYYGKNSSYFGFSSLPSGLEEYGIHPISLQPNSILSFPLGEGELSLEQLPFKFFSKPKAFTLAQKERVKRALVNSVEKRVKNEKHIGVMLSGGVDSATLALLAKRFNKNVCAYTIAIENSEDIAQAEKIADSLNIRFREHVIAEDELIDYYKRVRELYNEDMLKIELALSLFICLELMKKHGEKIFLNGQGAEELFAGYARHHELYLEKGNLREMLEQALLNLHASDLERNSLIASHFNAEARYPFLDLALIRETTKIKPEANFGKNGERKSILRRIARELGVPEEACARPKKAFQYSTGIHRLVMKHREELH
ncbi:MAG: asparagine synthetase B [Candidatus Micrarchaeota archaeon]